MGMTTNQSSNRSTRSEALEAARFDENIGGANGGRAAADEVIARAKVYDAYLTGADD